jgi:hypothetical protein
LVPDLSLRLGNGSGGVADDSDDIGVVAAWKWPHPLDGVSGHDFEAAATIIRAGNWREGIQAKDWVGRAVAKAPKLDLDSKPDKARAAGLVKVGINSGNLIVVEKPDEKRMARKYVEVADAA